MDKNNLIAAIRTAIAGAVGALVTWLATKGIDIDSDVIKGALQTIVFFFTTSVYNAGVNWLQAKYGKRWGFLLGIPKLPNYDPKDGE